MAQHEEIVLWLDRRWKKAIEKHLKGETLQEHLETVLDELCNQLPQREYERISREIYAEDAANREAEEAARTYAAYHVVENGQEWYYKTTPGEELLAVGKKLRGYVTKGSGVAPDKFIGMFFDGQPITAKEFDALTALRMENTGKVRGVFDVNFDKREFSAVHIIDGWQTWAMRDVSVAVYHATRSQFASGDDKWRKLLDHLNGKEITSAGHLSARNFSFGEEIIESDGKLNFYLQADFDVDAAFGTFVCTDQNDDWLNIYANYDIEKDRLCDTLELNLCKGDGTEENWSYHLNAAEQEVLARKMEDYCQQQTGMSLHEYAQQLRESGSRYQLSKKSGVPWATLADICSGKTTLSRCSAGTLMKLSSTLDIPMEQLITLTVEKPQMHGGKPTDRTYLEKDLPASLDKALREYIQGEKDKVSYMDCLWGELYSAINSNQWSNAITQEQADYLRTKYL